MSSVGGQQPTSFKTNVNRAKTKRWVEAKSYSYDGDDWGDADEYDEYGGYDEPPTPPKPTGLRQQGQSAGSVNQSLYGIPAVSQQRATESVRPVYGHVAGQPQQQYGMRSATNPQPSVATDLGRSNSFDRGDEKRAFSAGGYQYGTGGPTGLSQQQSMPEQPYDTPNVQTSTQFDPNQMRQVQPDLRHAQQQRPMPQQRGQSASESNTLYNPPANYRAPQSYEEPHQISMGSRAQSMTSNTSSLDIRNRRDFTPSALPPPLHTQSPPLQDSRPTSQRPPRSSSLSQTTQPPIPGTVQVPLMEASSEAGKSQREPTDSGADKPLPFVRPAEIYRRMQEDKERERQSQDSSRPSMDDMSPRADHQEPTTHPALRKESPNYPDPSARAPLGDVFDSKVAEERSQSLEERPNPIAEHESDEKPHQSISSIPTTGDKQQTPTSDATASSSREPQTSFQAGHSFLLPMLPEVARMSAFGESFLSNGGERDKHVSGTVQSSENGQQPSGEPVTFTGVSETDLQHQPSSGFRSVVNQAFDVTEDQIPPTPSSGAGSGIGRSTSGGTSVISPIISRGASTSKPNWDSKDVAEQPTTSPVAEEVENSTSLPLSSESTGTPRQAPERQEPGPPSFIPGHRRDLSTPSPNNSPAKTPALETNLQLRKPQEAELAVATPTEPDFGHRTSPTREQSGRVGSEPFSIQDRGNRNDASSQSKVRDLAGKFESTSSSRRGSDQSPTRRPGLLATTTPRTDLPTPNRPLGDRMDSFRPRLPGAWESYVSNAPLTASNKSLSDDHATFTDQIDKTHEVPEQLGEADSDSNRTELPETPTQAKHVEKNQQEPQQDPFSSVAAAGSALAGALAAAVGLDGNSRGYPAATEQNPTKEGPYGAAGSARSRSTSVNTTVRPEATRPPIPVTKDDDDVSSVAPTPPLKDSQLLGQTTSPSDYFQRGISANSQEYGLGSEKSTPVSRPPMPPTLSTDTGSQYESDRLRREIMRDLTPNVPSEPTTAESDSPYENEPRLPATDKPRRDGAAHESMVIPREYDRYWNGGSSTSSSRSSSRNNQAVAPKHVAQEMYGDEIQQDDGPRAMDDSPRDPRNNVRQDGATLSRPTIEPHRYSWEQPLQGQSFATKTHQSPLPTSPSHQASHDQGQGSLDLGNTYTEGPQPRQRDLLGSPTVTDLRGKELAGVSEDDPRALQSDSLDRQPPSEVTVSNTEAAGFTSEKQIIDEQPNAHDMEASYKGGLYEPYESSPLVERDVLVNSEVASNLPPPPVHGGTQIKIPAFREILALKSPQERISGYDEAREQFANLDSGLSHWLAVTSSQLPEHSDVLASVGRPPAAIMGHKPSSSRLLSGLRSTGSQQQYLSANSRPGHTSSDTSNLHSQGSSPSGTGSKISSQQVQAKGKDLLHSAGVFGGKANVAAKGLFSKGRSRLKEARGADKEYSPPSSPAPNVQETQPLPESGTKNVASESPQVKDPLDASEQTSRLGNHPQGHSKTDEEDSAQTTIRMDPDKVSIHDSPAEDCERRTPFQQVNGKGHPPRTSSLHQVCQLTVGEDHSSLSDAHHLEKRKMEIPSQDWNTLSSGSGEEPPKRHALQEIQGNSSLYNSPQPTERATALHHSAAPSDSPGHAIGTSTTNKQPQAISLPAPPSRSTTPQVNRIHAAANNAMTGPTSRHLMANRISEDSNGTFHTAENGHLSRPGSRSVQESLDTPRAERPETLGNENPMWLDGKEDRTPPSVLQPKLNALQSQAPVETREPPTKSAIDRVSYTEQARFEPIPPKPDYLAREPSLDNIAGQVAFDRPPSPVSPQHSIHNEPTRRQSTREPIYYGPQHDFDVKQKQHLPPRRSRSPLQLREDPGLQDHPAFRSAQSTSIQGQQYAPIGRNEVSTSRQRRSGYLSDENGSTTAATAENESKSKTNSRNSGFFMSLGASGKVGVPSVVSPTDMQPHISSNMPSTENDKRSKRGSLFRSHPGDKGSDGTQSIGGSPALGPAIGIDPLRQSSPPKSMSSQIDESPRGDSNKFRNKLQRASTSGNKAAEGGGKKKRFSALGSLFGSRSNRAQPTPAVQATQAQPDPGYQFPRSQPPQQQAPYSAHISSVEQSRRTPVSSVSQGQISTPGSNEANQYNPVRSDPSASQASVPVWSQTAQRVSQPRQTSIKEPSAYVQDSNLRQRATSPPKSIDSGPAPTSSAFTHSKVPDAPRSRTSLFSRSKSRESSVPGYKRASSGRTRNTATDSERPDLQSKLFGRQSQPIDSVPSVQPPTQGPQRVLTFSQFGENHIATTGEREQQAVQLQMANQQSQPAYNSRPQGTTSHGNSLSSQGPPRVLTFNQFGENHIAGSPSQIPPAQIPRQSSAVEGQHTNVVTFQQFPSEPKPQNSPRGESPPPPPPPPKDEWHVSRPRQSISQNVQLESRLQHEQSIRRSSTASPPSNQDPRGASQTQPQVQAQQRQAPPPIQTEIPSSRLSAFSPSNSSAESRKARQRELELARPSTEKETAFSRTKHDASSEDDIVMSSSSYPGQEWQPSFAYDD